MLAGPLTWIAATLSISSPTASCEISLQVARASNCPEELWHGPVAQLLVDKARGFKISLVNVGANKGYQVAKFLQLFTRSLSVSNRAWHAALLRVASEKLRRPMTEHSMPCGGCKECNATDVKLRSHNLPVHVHAIEALPANAALLREMFDEMKVPATLHHFIASNVSGTAYTNFKWGHTGDELSLFQAYRFGPWIYPMPSMSLTDFATAQNLTHIYWLTIDTEGFDALVLEGTYDLLRAHAIDVLEFEYHGLGYWRPRGSQSRNIADVVRTLHRLGYACYWNGNSGKVARANGQHWCDKFEIRRWSNLVCSHLKEVINALDTFT
jgi:FkbM family methyltransferase